MSIKEIFRSSKMIKGINILSILLTPIGVIPYFLYQLFINDDAVNSTKYWWE